MPEGERTETLVVGLGAMGSAAAYRLSRRGVSVRGLDRDHPPHTRGSSHGETRMIREAYFEHPLYVPLVQRAYELWSRLERESGIGLLRITGGLMIGPPDGTLLSGARNSARTHGLPHEELSAAEVNARFPGFSLPRDVRALFEKRAGFLSPERCIDVQLELAADLGARLHFGETVEDWEASAGTVLVRTDRAEYTADALVLAAGAWTASLVAGLRPHLRVERAVQHWLAPRSEQEEAHFLPERFPVFVWEHEPGAYWYGFPEVTTGVKLALHYGGEATEPHDLERSVGQEEVEAIRELASTYLAGAAGEHLRSSVCMYTNTPDLHFVVDLHPRHPEVVVASPCSGHGFKFASVLGEILADLAVEGRTEWDLSPFRADRFPDS